MAEDEGSAILATSILASFRPLSSLKRLAKLFSSSHTKNYYAGSSVTGTRHDSHSKDDGNQKTSNHHSNGSLCCPAGRRKSPFQDTNVLSSELFVSGPSDKQRDEFRLSLVKYNDVPAYLQVNLTLNSSFLSRTFSPTHLTTCHLLAAVQSVCLGRISTTESDGETVSHVPVLLP